MNIELGKRFIGSVDDSPAGPRRDPVAKLSENGNACFGSILKHATESTQPRRRPEGAVSSLEARNQIMSNAKADPTKALSLASVFAYNSVSGPLLDMSDWNNIRYSVSGEPVTSESTAYFAKNSLVAQQGLNELYQRETAKGTPAANILEKIFDYLDTQPRRFQEMIAW